MPFDLCFPRAVRPRCCAYRNGGRLMPLHVPRSQTGHSMQTAPLGQRMRPLSRSWFCRHGRTGRAAPSTAWTSRPCCRSFCRRSLSCAQSAGPCPWHGRFAVVQGTAGIIPQNGGAFLNTWPRMEKPAGPSRAGHPAIHHTRAKAAGRRMRLTLSRSCIGSKRDFVGRGRRMHICVNALAQLIPQNHLNTLPVVR